MAEWRKIPTKLWRDPEFLDMKPEEKLFYLYLLTNPNTTSCGCYKMSPRIVAAETGFNAETVEQLIEQLVRYEKIAYNSETKEVLVLNWVTYNPPSGKPWAKNVYQREVAEIKTPKFREAVLNARGSNSVVTTEVLRSNSRTDVDLDVDIDVDVEKTIGSASAEPTKATKIPKETIADLIETYKALKGVDLKGDEHKPVQRVMRQMLLDGNTPEQIKSLMGAFAASREKWAQQWTAWTLAKKLPEWRAGVLDLGQPKGDPNEFADLDENW